MDYSDSDDENRRQNKNSPHKKKVTRKCLCFVSFYEKIYGKVHLWLHRSAQNIKFVPSSYRGC